MVHSTWLKIKEKKPNKQTTKIPTPNTKQLTKDADETQTLQYSKFTCNTHV